MAKLKYGFGLLLLLTMWTAAIGQTYPVKYIAEDSSQIEKIGLIKTFSNRIDANSYLAGLLLVLHGKGFVTASIDSMKLDSADARVVLFWATNISGALFERRKKMRLCWRLFAFLK